jgi:hypothetical protein
VGDREILQGYLNYVAQHLFLYGVFVSIFDIDTSFILWYNSIMMIFLGGFMRTLVLHLAAMLDDTFEFEVPDEASPEDIDKAALETLWGAGVIDTWVTDLDGNDIEGL